ncbi:MAG TPA: hypothetical protein VF303_02615 [Candidatus Nanoarchaeia archaeon]
MKISFQEILIIFVLAVLITFLSSVYNTNNSSIVVLTAVQHVLIVVEVMSAVFLYLI